MPIIRKEEQHRPTVTGAEVEGILANSKRRYAVLFAVLAGTGLRIGEALGLKVTDLSPEIVIPLTAVKLVAFGINSRSKNHLHQAPKSPLVCRQTSPDRIAAPIGTASVHW